jgi:hypothetical protein
MNPLVSRLDSGGKTLTSIELLEECLSAIHRCRRSSLEDRLRSHRRNAASVSASKAAVKDGQAATAYHRNVTVSKIVRQESAEVPIRSINETAAATAPSPASKARKMPSTDSIKDDDDHDDTPNNAHLNEDIAVKAINELKDEINSWWEKNPKKRLDEDERGDFADFMTEKYLCQVLDPLPPSKKVSAVRKDVSQMLESFVATGALPPRGVDARVSGKSQPAVAVKPTGKQVSTLTSAASLSEDGAALLGKQRSGATLDKTKLVEPAPAAEGERSGKRVESAIDRKKDTSVTIEKQTGSSLEKKAMESRIVASGVASGEPSLLAGKLSKANNDSSYKIIEDKREKEKLQIKEQYERFRKMKADSDAIAASEHVKEFENNLDGIRNLLNSIQAAK